MKASAKAFWAYVDRSAGPQGCWPWQGGRNHDGHGWLRWANRTQYAHRVALELVGRPVLPGIVVRHLCHHAWCVNPAHLAPGTHDDNVADRVAAGRSACGERNGRSKLQAAQVLTLRDWHRRGLATVAELARLFGVTPRAVRFVLDGATWRGLGGAA